MFHIPYLQMLRRLTGYGGAVTVKLRMEQGKTASDAGRHADAAAAYRSAIALNPDCAEAHLGLGLARRDQHEFGAAVTSYRRATELRPDFVEAHNNLGAVLELQGKLDEALASYRRAVDLHPDFSQPYLNFGHLCDGGAQAAQCYRFALEHNVEPAVFRHLLDAAEGNTTERAPVEYTRAVFDNFASHFDQRLVEELDYRIPQFLGERIRTHLGRGGLRVLDIGCGTGLCGVEVSASCSFLAGLDLSPAMLAVARERRIYHELSEQDASVYLQDAAAATFDAVLAGDVFIYLGDLAPLFGQIAHVLRGGGAFAFSVEDAPAGRAYWLQPSGRYAHSVRYIHRLAAQSGLQVADMSPQVIRGKPGHAVEGYVFVLRKP